MKQAPVRYTLWSYSVASSIPFHELNENVFLTDLSFPDWGFLVAMAIISARNITFKQAAMKLSELLFSF